jgi:hypothetical protein
MGHDLHYLHSCTHINAKIQIFCKMGLWVHGTRIFLVEITPKFECVNIVKTLTISAKARATYAKMFYNIRQMMLLKYHTSKKII